MAEARTARALTVSEPHGTLAADSGAAGPGDTGQPIAEPPPLVEPIGFAEPAEIKPVPAAHRPVRRRFLAPVSPSGNSVERPALPEVRARTVTHEPLQLVSPAEPGGEPAAPAASIVEPTAPPSEAAAVSPKPARPRLIVALEIAALVILIAGGGLALRPQWTAPLRDKLSRMITREPASDLVQRPADPAQRFAANTRAAKAGDANAQLALAIQYAKGEGVARDFKAAAKWFQAAAENGVTRAQYDLGVLYERGRGVPLDYAKAVTWYKRAAEGKHPLAEYNLAVAYTKGEGVERNFYEAAVWYNRAALQGVIAAMVNLAILYERGEGVEASTANAYAWYRAAARRASQPAARRADELLAAFNPWEQTQAEARTSEIALSIQDSVGEAARAMAQNKAGAETDGASPILRSGLERDRGPAASDDAGDVNP
jgi:TPR repeat protein